MKFLLFIIIHSRGVCFVIYYHWITLVAVSKLAALLSKNKARLSKYSTYRLKLEKLALFAQAL
ncbi:MAG: hypothetical protein ACR2KB_11190, partial [Chitinophagaceae bacterium]